MIDRILLRLALSLPSAALAAAATSGEPPASQPASYAFATELGSGVYDVAGRTLQVYRLPFDYLLRPADADTPGLRLTLPLTVGFFNFSPLDVIHEQLPAHLDALSFVPGLELEYPLNERWHLLPHARFGGSLADGTFDALLYGAGLSSEYNWQLAGSSAHMLNDLTYAGVSFHSSAPSDELVRLRNGIEVHRGTDFVLRGHEIQIGVYGLADYFLEPPRPPVPGTHTSRVQLEPGILFGAQPDWRIHGWPLPRFGIGYRFAGDLSGLHIVVGAPF